ncbi:hypothetical protein ABLE68_03500 [Nocardioides sp. CN2-186]|uniref:hypothetical protein n=1 Tax=Nocardioides tweenelious TaxID=3156607 RepID=UPI0032B409D1
MSSERARTRASWAAALVLTGVVVVFNPMAGGAGLRAFLGIGQDVTFTITDSGPSYPRGAYAFALTQPGSDEPVTWDPCPEIHYVVNPDGGPADQQELVAHAVRDLTEASGLRFEYDGTTDDRTFSHRSRAFGDQPPVLIGWATPDEVPALAGDVAGVGGSEARSAGPDRLAYVTGMVALDRDAFAAMADRPGPDVRGAIVEHELVHVLGLGHVDDPAQLMYAETTDRTTLGAGDRAGLARVGGTCN